MFNSSSNIVKKEKLVSLCRKFSINEHNYIACTLVIPNEGYNNSIKQLEQEMERMGITYIGAVEYCLNKAKGYHLHFITKKENADYLFKRGVHIINGYDLNGWVNYMIKSNLATLTYAYITNNQVDNNKQPKPKPIKRKRKYIKHIITYIHELFTIYIDKQPQPT